MNLVIVDTIRDLEGLRNQMEGNSLIADQLGLERLGNPLPSHSKILMVEINPRELFYYFWVALTFVRKHGLPQIFVVGNENLRRVAQICGGVNRNF